MPDDWQLDLRALERELPAGGEWDTAPQEFFARWPVWPVLLPDAEAVRAGRFDVEAALWGDSMIHAPHENAARVLVVMGRVLAKTLTLGRTKSLFEETYLRLFACNPQTLQHVWTYPHAYYWTRAIFGFLRASVMRESIPTSLARKAETLVAENDHDPLHVLNAQVCELSNLAIGAAAIDGTHWSNSLGHHAALPFAIPATRLSIGAGSDLTIFMLASRRLTYRIGRRDKEKALSELRECSVASVDGIELPISSDAFSIPGLDFALPAIRAGMDYQREHAPLLEKALQNVSRFAPEIFKHFRKAIKLAALKPLTAGKYDDFSEPELPGSFIMSVVHNPLELGDHLIHEFQHNRLSFLEEYGPLFAPGADDSPSSSVKTAYYSPWRDKPRSLYGVYHGVYVFIAVTRYWLRVYESNDLPARDRAYVTDRLIRLPRQLRLAMGVLEKHARLTTLGAVVLTRLATDVQTVCAEVAGARLPEDAQALKAAEDGSYVAELSRLDGKKLTVREALREHLKVNDPVGQYAGLLD